MVSDTRLIYCSSRELVAEAFLSKIVCLTIFVFADNAEEQDEGSQTSLYLIRAAVRRNAVVNRKMTVLPSSM
jgi:hypothetical protein